MGVNGEALQLHAVYKSRIFYYKSRENLYQYCKSCENPYQVLQVTRESVSSTYKSRVLHLNVQWGSYDKIIVPSYTGKNITRLLHTDGNKLVIFSGIALYYGDTYIILMVLATIANSVYAVG